MTKLSTFAAGAALLILAAGSASATTLEDVQKKGFVQCGVSEGLPGFSNPDEKGNWTGIDVDVCRAVAAGVFGDQSKVKYSPLSAKVRFTALQSGEVDMLSRNTTWTETRDTALGLNFTGVNFYDGQGFLVRKSLGVKSAKELSGATVCVNIGTTTELNVADYFRANNMKFTPVVFEHADEVVGAYDAGRCDVYTTDRSGLAAQRTKMKNPDEHVVLPEVISKEPLGPVVRHGDDQWFDIVKWSLFAMINAEEMGLTSKNIDQYLDSKNPAIQRFVGTSGDLGKMLGLDDRWAYNIVKQVGNYGESFDANLKPLGFERGLNALWTHGGIMYAPPIR